MLLDAKLSQKFWAEAVSTATYLRNRLPHCITAHFMKPDMGPCVNHLRVFDSMAYVHIPKDERGKLS